VPANRCRWLEQNTSLDTPKTRQRPTSRLIPDTGFTVFPNPFRSSKDDLLIRLEASMEARAYSPSFHSSDWKQLYMAALFEDDSAKIPQRIADAETALAAARTVELNEDANYFREQRAMENAAYFLQLLRKIESKANTSYDSPHPVASPPRHQEDWISANYSEGSRPVALGS
jgi:hypothetical protein